jgi:hypothetical protein
VRFLGLEIRRAQPPAQRLPLGYTGAVFEPIRLEWNGAEYRIPADNVLRGIAKVEEVITLPELVAYEMRGTVPLAKVAMAYGALLRLAGAQAKDEEVFASLFGNGLGQAHAMGTAAALLATMIPPPVLRKRLAGDASARAGKLAATT